MREAFGYKVFRTARNSSLMTAAPSRGNQAARDGRHPRHRGAGLDAVLECRRPDHPRAARAVTRRSSGTPFGLLTPSCWILARYDLAHRRAEIDVQSSAHIAPVRLGAVTVVEEVICDHDFDDLAKYPRPRSEQRCEMGKLAVANAQVPKLVLPMIRRDEPNSTRDLS